ncbi:MAG TPA: acetyl-CoA carboxylase biotin carboxylase subunit, partial [Thermoanaerobaculia bacterium]|nr:acetyl-CoA carboxylase biotin carboxylase subunit [Thermoanaerobaculia bacterium]
MPTPAPFPTKPIRKILVANRGEIAVRILRACRDLGLAGAVVYSEPDRRSLPVLLADEAYPIGPAPSAESYLRAEAIVELAVEIGADAIHPGYGFLSERESFARLCRDAGVVFIGPPPEAIAAMGSKTESRRRMLDAGVPVVPGGRDPLPDLDAARAAAAEIGYPVMLKAAAGGGGKGMRRVDRPDDLAGAFRAARSEAAASFGDDTVYLERYLVDPRHVEIQVLADAHGRTVSLGERECSLQRRHQKVVEEAPSPAVGPELRRRMGEAAVAAARAVGYVNAGTVEMLLDRDGRFYFLEMNTRLQVEHPVTEMVTGLDLVAWQIRIAGGEPLPEWFERIEPRGHAVEVRLYAEDPFRGFAPSPGTIRRLRLPQGPGVRNDCGVDAGAEVTVHYDPMLAKLICWGDDREHALARLGRALAELRVDGIHSTAPLFAALLADPDFRAGRLDIGMLDRKLAAGEL